MAQDEAAEARQRRHKERTRKKREQAAGWVDGAQRPLVRIIQSLEADDPFVQAVLWHFKMLDLLKAQLMKGSLEPEAFKNEGWDPKVIKNDE